MELALGPGSRGQFNASVARAAFGAGDIGLSHIREITTEHYAELWACHTCFIFKTGHCKTIRLLRDKEARPKLAGQLILARVYLVRGDMFDENVIAVWALE